MIRDKHPLKSWPSLKIRKKEIWKRCLIDNGQTKIGDSLAASFISGASRVREVTTTQGVGVG